jgi:hypothetical protein
MQHTIGLVILFGFGCSGGGMSAPAVCDPVGPNGQLDPQAAGSMVVAPDERHAAFFRDPHRIDAGWRSAMTAPAWWRASI